MKLRAVVWSLAFAAAGFLFAGCVAKPSLQPGRTTLGKGPIILSAEVVGNHFMIETKWDKRSSWRFLIDTGSSVTLVSPEFAKRYAADQAGLTPPPVRVQSADGTSTLLPSVILRQIGLGEARFESVQALVYDCADLSAHFGVKIDGILGFPLFQNTLLTLDYPGSRLLLAPVGESLVPPGATIKFNNTQRIPLIPVKLGQTTFAALIDSGCDGSLVLNPIGLSPHFIFGPRPGTTVGTLTGNSPQEIGRISEPLSLGIYSFKNPVVDLTDQLSAIGGDVLRYFSVTFDQSKNQVTFYRDTAAPIEPSRRRSSGLSFSKTPVYWRVAGVVPGSPADIAGIQLGDLVTRINGEPVADWSLQRWETFVRRVSEVTFTFLQGTTENPVVISTFDLVP